MSVYQSVSFLLGVDSVENRAMNSNENSPRIFHNPPKTLEIPKQPQQNPVQKSTTIWPKTT